MKIFRGMLVGGMLAILGGCGSSQVVEWVDVQIVSCAPLQNDLLFPDVGVEHKNWDSSHAPPSCAVLTIGSHWNMAVIENTGGTVVFLNGTETAPASSEVSK